MNDPTESDPTEEDENEDQIPEHDDDDENDETDGCLLDAPDLAPPPFLHARIEQDISVNPLLGAAAIRGCKLLLEDNIYLHQQLGHGYGSYTKRIPGLELQASDDHPGFCRLEGDELVIRAEAGE